MSYRVARRYCRGIQMTVKELIEELQHLDPELKVYVPGYEGGCEDPSIELVKVKRDENPHRHYNGTHVRSTDGQLGVLLS